MLWIIATALAAEQQVYWQPQGLPDGALLGQYGFVSADFDDDGVLDVVAEYVVPDVGVEILDAGFVVRLSSQPDEILMSTGDEVYGFHMDALDLDQDGVPELILSQVQVDDGGLFALDPIAFADPSSFEDHVKAYIEGNGGTQGGFGTHWDIADMNGDGVPEFFMAEPLAPGSVWIMELGPLPADLRASADAVGRWEAGHSGWGAVVVQPSAGLPDVLLAICDNSGAACNGNAGVVRMTGDLWNAFQGVPPVANPLAVQGPPTHPFRWPDVDGDGQDELAWPDVDQILLANETGQVGLLALPGRIHELLTSDGLWVIQDGVVGLYADPLNGPVDETTPIDGAERIALLGQVDQDACPEILVSAPASQTLFRVDAACGSTGTDSGDSGDSGGDSGPGPDSDSGIPDTGPAVVCEPEFGWTCGSAAPTGAAALFLLGLGLLGRRRR